MKKVIVLIDDSEGPVYRVVEGGEKEIWYSIAEDILCCTDGDEDVDRMTTEEVKKMMQDGNDGQSGVFVTVLDVTNMPILPTLLIDSAGSQVDFNFVAVEVIEDKVWQTK